MLNSDYILHLIERIAADSKKTAKEALLREHAGDEMLKRELEMALNPFKTYGVKALPTRAGDGCLVIEERHWRLLDDLCTPELSGGAPRAGISDALNGLSAESAQFFSRILRKDLRAGFGENTTDKVFPRLIPELEPEKRSLLDPEATPWTT